MIEVQYVSGNISLRQPNFHMLKMKPRLTLSQFQVASMKYGHWQFTTLKVGFGVNTAPGDAEAVARVEQCLEFRLRRRSTEYIYG